MTRPPVMGLVIMMLVGTSGCAGVPQRFSWSSPPGTSEDRTDSPATARHSWLHRSGSPAVDAGDTRQDLAQSSPARSQPQATRSRQDLWPERRSEGLARFFPSLSRRWNAAETSRSSPSQPVASTPNSAGGVAIHSSRPVTRFRDVTPELEEGQDTSAAGVSAIAAAMAPSANEGEVLRASLRPREQSASSFASGILPPQSPVSQTSSGELKGSSLVATSQPAPAPALLAMSSSGEPENLLPQSLMRDQDGPSDSPLALAPIQDPPPSSQPTTEKTQEKKSNKASAPAEKQSSKPASPPAPPPAPRRKPEIPAPKRPESSSEPQKSNAATKPAADELKVQSPELEPAPPIQPPASAPATRPELQKGVRSMESPPPPPSAVREPAAPSAPAPSAVTPPAPAVTAPPSPVAPPPAVSGSADAGYAPSPSATAETLSWPDLDGKIKTLPTAQLPAPSYPTSYQWSQPSAQVLPAPQTGCVAYPTKTKKCDWKPGKYTLILCRKLKCLKQFIHEHCPLKKKASKTCCQNCPCCGPMYIGAMPSAQWISGSPLFAPASFLANPSPPTPQASLFASPFGREAADASPESLSAPDSSAGTKPGDVSQRGEDLEPIAADGLDKTP